MRIPKVLVVTVTYEGKDYCFDKFFKSANELTYPNMTHIYIDNSRTLDYTQKLKDLGLEVYHVERGNNSREALSRSLNLGRRKCLDEGYDYMFVLESDVVVPKDIIQNLMKHAQDIVTGLYYIGDGDPRIPCITMPDFKKDLNAFGSRLLTMDERHTFFMNGLQRVAAGSFGCSLNHRNVLEQIKFYYDPRLPGHPDIYLYNTCFEKKIPVFVDTNIICQHYNVAWSTVKDR